MEARFSSCPLILTFSGVSGFGGQGAVDWLIGLVVVRALTDRLTAALGDYEKGQAKGAKRTKGRVHVGRY